MKIGIIGAGFIGQAVGKILLKAGHQVLISNSRGPNTLYSVKSALPGAETGTVEEACDFANMVLVATPLSAYPTLPANKLANKIILDTGNYYPERDGQIPELEDYQTTTSTLLAKYLPQSTIIKVFNAIIARHIEIDARPIGAPDRRALPIAGDNESAKQQVMSLVNELGFDPVDTGSLEDSWRFERGKPSYCFHLNKETLQQALGQAERTVELPPEAWREVINRRL